MLVTLVQASQIIGLWETNRPDPSIGCTTDWRIGDKTNDRGRCSSSWAKPLTLQLFDGLGSCPFRQEQAGGRGWLVAAAGRGTPAPNPSNHPLHKSLVYSKLECQIIPSTMNLCVPHRSAPHPLLNQDLQASQHPAVPAFIYLSYK
ncbi:unnamed protein product [Pleuronectes platessa]|uniref:Uncharacterized protein n=1 Tax=Pleuronectes platessa TaxID=8262 RepID=A0A9N7URM8_PLEPL|nr:unnamed protein product [Pleuronectes platessa]